MYLFSTFVFFCFRCLFSSVERLYSFTMCISVLVFKQSFQHEIEDRDLTINTIMYSPLSNTFIHPHIEDVWEDLEHRLFRYPKDIWSRTNRTTEDSTRAYYSEYKRLLRLNRLKARLNFKLDEPIRHVLQQDIDIKDLFLKTSVCIPFYVCIYVLINISYDLCLFVFVYLYTCITIQRIFLLVCLK